GLPPAAVHHIYHRGLSGHDALIATLINLAIKKRIRIDRESRKKTTLTRLEGGEGGVEPFEAALEQKLLVAPGGVLTFGDKYNAAVTSAYTLFRTNVGQKYGRPYFRWN